MKYELSVLFTLKKNKVDKAGEVPIYLRITVNSARVEVSTNQKIEVSKWDTAAQRAKGRSEAARLLNDSLDNSENRIKRDFNSLIEKEEIITAEKLRNMLIGKHKKDHYLVDVFEKNNQLIGMEIGSKYTKDTIARYHISIVRLKAFLQKEFAATDIKLSELNHIFIRKYDIFIRSEYSCDHNTAMKYLKHLKKVIHFAMEMGYIERDPFFQYKTAYKEVSRGYLTSDELNQIETHVFNLKRLSQVRDVFVFVCYTGLSYSDLKTLSPESITKGIDGKNWIIYERNKTGVRASIPLMPKAQFFVDKYKVDSECIAKCKLLPIISNQKLNSYLAEIEELCEIDKHITMHLGRHTFATTVTLTNGVPIETVSKMLGHTSLKTTQIYSKVVDTKISRDMEKLESCLTEMNLEREIIKNLKISETKKTAISISQSNNK